MTNTLVVCPGFWRRTEYLSAKLKVLFWIFDPTWDVIDYAKVIKICFP